MKIHQVEQKTPEWDLLRAGKISGTAVREKYSKNWVYNIVAERLGYTDVDETEFSRGNRLEGEAREAVEAKLGKKVEEAGFCTHDDYEAIASSPDGLIKDKEGKYTEAVEIKCFGTVKHIGIYFSREIPKANEMQVIQYFVVNPDLERLYFCCYDDRIKEIPLIIIEKTREELRDKIEASLENQKRVLKEVDEIIQEIVFK